MGSFLTIALLIVFGLIVIGGIAAVASALGKRHSHKKSKAQDDKHSGRR